MHVADDISFTLSYQVVINCFGKARRKERINTTYFIANCDAYVRLLTSIYRALAIAPGADAPLEKSIS